MITGIGVFFSSFCVCALNALQNSMLWGRERRGPEPMGGDGSAAPAGTCSFRYPVTFFAILFSLLVVRRLTAGDRPHLPRLVWKQRLLFPFFVPSFEARALPSHLRMTPNSNSPSS